MKLRVNITVASQRTSATVNPGLYWLFTKAGFDLQSELDEDLDAQLWMDTYEWTLSQYLDYLMGFTLANMTETQRKTLFAVDSGNHAPPWMEA